MNLPIKDFCFCTYAASKTYRTLAKNLISDLEKFAPGFKIILYTDKPQDFMDYQNVLVFPHQRQGVLHYHERRFAIAKALSMFNSCIYLDADVRICAPISENLEWIPGITARSCANMTKHFEGRLNKTNPPPANVVKIFNLFKKMGQKLDIDVEKENITWINEFLFVVTKDNGKEQEFLNYWEKLAFYADVNGLHQHPAYAIGLAAAKAGLTIRHDNMEGIDFFDDRIEKVRIAQGISDANAKQAYFETQNKVENARKSFFQKILNKFNKFWEYVYYFNRLKINVLFKDYKFYYD